MRHSLAILTVTLCCLVGSLPSSAQIIVFPESWEGEWEFTSMIMQCGSGTVDTTEVDTVSICGGDRFELIDGFYECTGSITDSVIDLDCSFSFDARPTVDCVTTYSIVIDGTISGDTITGTQTETVTHLGTGCVDEDTCEDEAISGVRISSNSGNCFTPVERITWGRIKATYD